MLTKLNALEDQLDAMTAKLNATTTKLDALTLKTKDVWETTHYTKGYVQNGIQNLMDMGYNTCWIATEARGAAEYAAWSQASNVVHPWHCP